MPWLLKKETADELVSLRRELLPHAAASNPRAAYAAAKESGKVVAGPDAVMSIEGGVAEIRVEGVLTPEPDPCAWFFGVKNTAYNDIRAALAQAEADSNVKSVQWMFDSPGGNVDGLFDTLAAIQAFTKPQSVLANQACSAAYAMAAVAGKIKATNPAACFGSIGVAASIRLQDDVVDLTSTEAPDKRPDVATEAGRAVYVRHLDAYHDLFVDAIADGRGTEASTVNETYGRGATLLAGEALRLGMIDSVVQPLRAIRGGKAKAADTGASTISEEKDMDLKTLKAQHPQLVDDLLAEGRAQGVTAEHERCVAHLTMGKQAGPKGLEIAVAAIEGKESFGMLSSAKYLSVAMNHRDVSARQAESDAVGAVVDGANPTAVAKDLGDEIVALMDAKSGKKTTNG